MDYAEQARSILEEVLKLPRGEQFAIPIEVGSIVMTVAGETGGGGHYQRSVNSRTLEKELHDLSKQPEYNVQLRCSPTYASGSGNRALWIDGTKTVLRVKVLRDRTNTEGEAQ